MLIAENICKKYNKSNSVLNSVSFTASPGEIVGIAGENGSGKSTLIYILTTLTKPDQGKVYLMDHDIFKHPELVKRFIGFVPQENALFDSLSVSDNIKFWAAAYGADARLVYFPKEYRGYKVSQLSGGMKKRLSIAIALMNNPDYLIMDEPTSALDIRFKKELTSTILEMKNNGKTIIFTSHQPDELLVCDRLYILKGGVFIYSGKPEELSASKPFHEALYDITNQSEPLL